MVGEFYKLPYLAMALPVYPFWQVQTKQQLKYETGTEFEKKMKLTVVHKDDTCVAVWQQQVGN